MRTLPRSDLALVIRTDYSNQQTWETVREMIITPVDGFHAYVQFVEEAEYGGISKDEVMELFRGTNQSYAMVVDGTTISDPDHPVLVVDLFANPGAEFRAVPSQIQSVENNLSLGNMDFADFGDNVDESGVFRGFPQF